MLRQNRNVKASGTVFLYFKGFSMLENIFFGKVVLIGIKEFHDRKII